MPNIVPNNVLTPEVISFKTMRLFIGVLGILMPFVLLAGSFLPGGCGRILGSISAYYHTRMRDVFVGILCAVSFFLFSYKGYDQEDFLLCKFASLYALGIAFCPTLIKNESLECMTLPLPTNEIISNFHYFFAAGFFAIIACISMCVFTKTHPNDQPVTGKKKDRNIVYIACGIVIMACIIIIPIYDNILRKFFTLPNAPIFWLETGALASFGISWLVKGEAISALNDEEGR
jgi:hypothetical protein